MKVLALTGGVGGAKLCLGLAHCLNPNEVQFVVNTGDDFEHLGFHISPDIDTLTYTLADRSNTELGWGRRDESWQFIESFEELGGETWFRLGDRDLALHVRRRELLSDGHTLTEATAHVAKAWGVDFPILPMSDDPIRTIVHTPDGSLTFQHYFVRDRCEPSVTGFAFEGIESAALNRRIDFDDLDAIVICPSNPFVSVDPVLDIPGMRQRMKASGAPIIAISPIVRGQAIKGPTAKMMRELSIPATTASVAAHYQDLVDTFVIDVLDADAATEVEALGMKAHVTQTVMKTLDDRVDLAKFVLDILE